MTRRVLITGMEGFVGSHLAEYALARGAEVHGTAFPTASRDNLKGARRARCHALDICDEAGVFRLMQRVRPDWVFHLAGQSNVHASATIPEKTLAVNVLGSAHVLEACRRFTPRVRLLTVGSSNAYGRVHAHELPIKETHDLRPENPYAVSKVCQDLTSLYYFQQFKLHVVRVRPFNHIGPRQSPDFVCSDFARQIAAIEQGKHAPVLRVGNLAVERDFTDVQDIIHGYWLALQKGKAGEVYNLCSGRAIAIEALLQGLVRLSSARIRIERVHAKTRRREASVFYGSFAKFQRQTGWRPQIPLTQTLQTTLDYWRARVRTD